MEHNPNPDDQELAATLRASGVVDTHYHIGPELLPRRYDVLTLARAAREWNATIVLKNHTYPTTPLASLARAHYGVRFLGGLVLNRFVGGLNADAIHGAVSGNRSLDGNARGLPPVVVWMPTVHAEAHLRVLGQAFDPRWGGGIHQETRTRLVEFPVRVFDADLRPVPALLDALRAISLHGAVLATGHLSAEEVMRLVPLALEEGVRRIIVTHPHYPCVALSKEQLCALVAHPEVFVEHCFAIHTIEQVPLEAIADAIRATGPEQVLLSTDFGQVHSGPFPHGTLDYAQRMQRLLLPEIGQSEMIRMFSSNGRRALGLDANDSQADQGLRETGFDEGVSR